MRSQLSARAAFKRFWRQQSMCRCALGTFEAKAFNTNPLLRLRGFIINHNAILCALLTFSATKSATKNCCYIEHRADWEYSPTVRITFLLDEFSQQAI
jgi:hypothetical protein